MTHRTTTLSAFSVALALALSGAAAARADDTRPPAPAARPSPAPDFKIGVVDLALVFKQYKRSADLEMKINEERDRLRRDLEEQRKVVLNYNKELELLDPVSETYQVKEDEKDAAYAKWERTKKRLEETIKKRWEEYNNQILEDIEGVIRAYGEEQRFTLIFKVDGKSSDEARLPAGLKSVLYFAKELDVTPAVVELLNRRHDGQARPPGPLPQPSPAPGGPGGGRPPSPPGTPNDKLVPPPGK